MISLWVISKNFLFIGIMLFILVATLVLLLSFIIVFSKNDRQYKKTIKNMDMLSHTIVVDGKNNTVTVVHKNQLRKKKVETLDYYLYKIAEIERPLFVQWIQVLLDGKETASFLELAASKKKKKQNYFYRLMEVDTKNKIIHLEVFSIYYSFSKGTSKDSKKLIVSIPQINSRLSLLKEKVGYCFYIRFYHPQIKSERINQLESMIVAQLKNLVYPLLHSSRVVVTEQEAHMVLFDFKMSKDNEAKALANEICKKISRFISINSLEGIYKYSIGICPFALADTNYLSLCENAEIASLDAEFIKDHTSFYKEEMRNLLGEKNVYQLEVPNLLKPSSFVSKYRPMVSLDDTEIFGYYSNVEFETPIFSSMREMKEYAERAERLKDLFSMMVKLSISNFNSVVTSDDLRLFYPVSILEKNMIVKSFSHLSGIKDSHIVVVFELAELSNRMMDMDDFLMSLQNIKEHDIEVALLVNQKDLLLPTNVLCLFDYFIIDKTFANLSKKDNNIRVMVHSIIERLKSYSMPIIAIDVDNWNTIDFLAKLGVERFSSDVIAPYSEKLEKIEKRVLLKLTQMNNQ